jgi:hypothetical protein
MSRTLAAVPEPATNEPIEPAEDPAFGALLRSLELANSRASAPRAIALPSSRRDPYYLD